MTESPLVDSGFVVLVFYLRDDPIACLNMAMAFLTAVSSSRFPSTNNPLRTSSNLRNHATIQDGRVTVQQARVVKCYNCQGKGHMARQCTQAKRPRNATWYKEKAMLVEALEARQILDEEQLAFLADPGVPNVLMANISNYGSDVISEVPHSESYLNDMENQSQSAHIVYMLTKPQAFYNNIHKQALGYQNLFYLKKAQQIKPTLYDGIVISNKHVAMPVIDDEEALILEEDFRKRFVLQPELSADEAFWYHMLNPSTKSSDALLIKLEAPKELPKVILVNESLKKLKLHLANFDKVVKIRTTPNARTKGEWGFEHTKDVFNNEIIIFLKSLKDNFNMFDRDLLNEIMEARTVFDQMDTAVQQSSVDKHCLEIAKKELFLENDLLLHQIMSQDVLLTVMNSMSLIDESVNVQRKRNESCDMCFNLEAELLKSQNTHNDILKRCSQLEKHCISLESSIQLNQEIFQKDESCDNKKALEIPEFFKNNDLKAQLQDKYTTICKLKDIIKSLREKSKNENVNYDYVEIKTKNMELENSVAKLVILE
nr:hypothetical protein [Tanacetum cinerariifolium]